MRHIARDKSTKKEVVKQQSVEHAPQDILALDANMHSAGDYSDILRSVVSM